MAIFPQQRTSMRRRFPFDIPYQNLKEHLSDLLHLQSENFTVSKKEREYLYFRIRVWKLYRKPCCFENGKTILQLRNRSKKTLFFKIGLKILFFRSTKSDDKSVSVTSNFSSPSVSVTNRFPSLKIRKI